MADVESPKAKWPAYILIAAIVVAVVVLKWGAFWEVTSQKSVPLVYTYDFSKAKALKEPLVVKYYYGSEVSVVLPVGVRIRKDPDSDVRVFYPMDNRVVIDGPGRETHTPGGLERTVFRIRGLEKAGVMKIWISRNRG